jgi:ssDNA-binding Zn-finger/Zn-ribbon topoisomerase 1
MRNCTFCGDSGSLIVHKHGAFVRCRNRDCHFTAPHRSDHKEALLLWDRLNFSKEQANEKRKCPFCEANPIVSQSKGGMVALACVECGLQGPGSFMLTDAIRKWNGIVG